MKGYYIWAPLEAGCIGNGSGIEKKIHAQVNTLQKSLDVELRVIPPHEYHKIDRIISRIPLCPVGTRWIYHNDMNDADFIYMRQVQHDAIFLHFLKNIKKQNPKVKIIYEIPTYPYESEQKITTRNVHLIIKDRYHRRKLKKYVDRIVTFYGQDRIFGIPTLKARNGFEFSSVAVNKSTIDRETINVIEVSTTAFWHGYDRFLSGLRAYYTNGGRRNIIFHMVGLILPEHKRYVEENDLKSHVVFHGTRSGKELKNIYEKCVVGVDVLGGHRKNYPISSSLKSREYAAHGIPVITSSPIDYIESDYPYQLIVPYDDSPVNIREVIDFVDSCYKDKHEDIVRHEIRQYGIEHCDMAMALQPVIDFIKA